jgi:hypothetical protein
LFISSIPVIGGQPAWLVLAIAAAGARPVTDAAIEQARTTRPATLLGTLMLG